MTMRLLTFLFFSLMTWFTPVTVLAAEKYASIVVDADTLDIVHARKIDELRFPASLTKVMTLYLTFDALNNGTLKLDEKLPVSKTAARTPPVKLGLKAGRTITVDEAIQGLAVKSANDVAVVLAERLAGSEEAFAKMMTAKARDLHMRRTVFKNASGLPDPKQKTTARDMAKLAAATITHHRRYYHYFGQKEFSYGGKHYKNTNKLLPILAGVDGFKTGYTRASGYNLIISAQREGRRIIAVVLGGASGKSRNEHMQDLVERSFKTLGVKDIKSYPTVTVKEEAVPRVYPTIASAVRLRGRNSKPVTIVNGANDVKIADRIFDNSWAIQVGAFRYEKGATAQIDAVGNLVGLNRIHGRVAPLKRGNQTLYRARFEAMSASQARSVCAKLQHLASGCLVIGPGAG